MIRVASVYAVALTLSLVCCSIARGQALDFKVDGPTTVLEGEYVELTVMFPEGAKADVDFTPIEEAEFGVHPVVSETLVKGKLTAAVVGRKCTFSARCQGERDLIVVATAFASFDGVPRVKSLKHRIRVTAKQGPQPPVPAPPPAPTPPPKPPSPPDDDDDLGPIVPLPGASAPKSDMEKVTAILSNIVDRLEALEKRSTQTAVVAPAAVADTSEPPVVPVVVKPAPVVASTAIVDVRPGHWSVGSDWSPTKAQAIAHLRSAHPSKARQHEPLESLSLEAVLTLHDDSHEGRTSATTRTVSASPVAVYTRPVVRMNASPCPGGVCPTSSSSRSYGRTFFRWGR